MKEESSSPGFVVRAGPSKKTVLKRKAVEVQPEEEEEKKVERMEEEDSLCILSRCSTEYGPR